MSLYPISTACPKCGANAHQVCKTGSIEACDERWIAAGAHVIDSPTTNPETAGAEPVACLTCLGFGYLRKAPSTCSVGGDLMPCPVCRQSPGVTTRPAPEQAPDHVNCAVGEDDLRAALLKSAEQEEAWAKKYPFNSSMNTYAARLLREHAALAAMPTPAAIRAETTAEIVEHCAQIADLEAARNDAIADDRTRGENHRNAAWQQAVASRRIAKAIRDHLTGGGE